MFDIKDMKVLVMAYCAITETRYKGKKILTSEIMVADKNPTFIEKAVELGYIELYDDNNIDLLRLTDKGYEFLMNFKWSLPE